MPSARIAYRGFDIYPSLVSYHPKTDYTYTHQDYDGAPDAYDNRAGFCGSPEECRAEIDEWYLDQEASNV